MYVVSGDVAREGSSQPRVTPACIKNRNVKGNFTLLEVPNMRQHACAGDLKGGWTQQRANNHRAGANTRRETDRRDSSQAKLCRLCRYRLGLSDKKRARVGWREARYDTPTELGAPCGPTSPTDLWPCSFLSLASSACFAGICSASTLLSVDRDLSPPARLRKAPCTSSSWGWGGCFVDARRARTRSRTGVMSRYSRVSALGLDRELPLPLQRATDHTEPTAKANACS